MPTTILMHPRFQVNSTINHLFHSQSQVVIVIVSCPPDWRAVVGSVHRAGATQHHRPLLLPTRRATACTIVLIHYRCEHVLPPSRIVNPIVTVSFFLWALDSRYELVPVAIEPPKVQPLIHQRCEAIITVLD